MTRLTGFIDRHELPTLALGLVLYGSWTALIVFHDQVPLPLLFVLGGYVTQWHFSLQHESIHGMRSWPAWLRTAFVWPPIGLWMPYPLYNRSHSTHHVNFNLTHPALDTESAYQLQGAWGTLHPVRRTVLQLNQTLWFRLVFGPFLRLERLAKREVARVRQGDFGNVKHWIVHAVGVGLLLGFVHVVAGMSVWTYLLCFAYPGMSLGMLRTFIEHRYGERPMERVALVESNAVMGTLYLFNNLHLVHHRQPTLPWYRIPARYRAEREELLRLNGGFFFRGYLQIARLYAFRPVFQPIHPKW